MERGWMQFPVPESCIDLKEDLDERDNRPIMLRVFLYALCVSEESASSILLMGSFLLVLPRHSRSRHIDTENNTI